MTPDLDRLHSPSPRDPVARKVCRARGIDNGVNAPRRQPTFTTCKKALKLIGEIVIIIKNNVPMAAMVAGGCASFWEAVGVVEVQAKRPTVAGADSGPSGERDVLR